MFRGGEVGREVCLWKVQLLAGWVIKKMLYFFIEEIVTLT